VLTRALHPASFLGDNLQIAAVHGDDKKIDFRKRELQKELTAAFGRSMFGRGMVVLSVT